MWPCVDDAREQSVHGIGRFGAPLLLRAAIKRKVTAAAKRTFAAMEPLSLRENARALFNCCFTAVWYILMMVYGGLPGSSAARWRVRRMATERNLEQAAMRPPLRNRPGTAAVALQIETDQIKHIEPAPVAAETSLSAEAAAKRQKRAASAAAAL